MGEGDVTELEQVEVLVKLPGVGKQQVRLGVVPQVVAQVVEY